MRKNKKLILISGILSTAAIMAVPAVSIVSNINIANGSDNQLDNVAQNDQQVEIDGIDNNIDPVEDNDELEAIGERFVVDHLALANAGWGTDITGSLVFTILDDNTRTVSVKAEDVTTFEAKDFIIKNTIINTDTGVEYSITEIASQAFRKCIGLTNVTIGSGVTVIGASAFSGCAELTGVTFGSGLQTISDHAFYECSMLTIVIIPDSVTTIADGAFAWCPLSAIELGTNKNFIRATNLGNNCTVILPASSSGIFINNSKVVGNLAYGELVLPNDIETIAINAFQNCSALTGTLVIPASVTSIGDAAFQNCDFLSIGVDSANTAFSKAKNLGPNCQAIIDNKTEIFNGTSKIAGSLGYGQLILPDNLTAISNRAFFGCAGLTGSLTISKNVNSIGSFAFMGCSKLTALDLSNAISLEAINIESFRNCSSLTGTLTIPASVTSIGYSAFFDCSNLTGTLTIPASVTSIGAYAFSNCFGLTALNLSIATSLKTIGLQAFNGCTGLTGTLIIPSSVTTIGDYAFVHCSGLTGTLTIPASVTSIGDKAFNDIGSKDFQFLSETPPTLGINIFGSNVEKTLWVSSSIAKNNYDRLVTDFGLASTIYIMVETPPTSVDILLSKPGPFTIDLNYVNQTITMATAEVEPMGASIKDVTWSLFNNPSWLEIDPNGNVTASDALKNESPGLFSFKVKAVCQGGDQTIEKITEQIDIEVIYASVSKVAIDPIASANILLGDPAITNLKQCTAKIEPENYDPLTRVEWSIIGDKPEWLEINSLTGMISTTAPIITAMPDSKEYTIQLKVLDNPNLTATTPFTINFTKPAPETITIAGVEPIQTIKANEVLVLNPTVSRVAPEYASTDVEWSLSQTDIPLGMSINKDTGEVSFTATKDHVNQTYNFNIIAKTKVSDSSTEGTFPVQLAINYANVTGVTVGEIKGPFDLKLGEDKASLVTCTATVNPDSGTNQAVTWSIAKKDDTAAPSWLQISNSGTISVNGATDIALLGPQIYTVKATSKQDTGQSGTKDFTINFTRPNPTGVVINYIAPFDLNLGQDNPNLVTCTATVNPNPGASQVVKWSIEEKLEWISIDEDSGVIAVKNATDASLMGTHTITVKAISEQDNNINGTETFTINFSKYTPTNDLNLGAIIGGTIGGLAGAAAIAGGTTYGVKRYKTKKSKISDVTAPFAESL